MSAKLDNLGQKLKDVFGDRIAEPQQSHGELTVTVDAANYLAVATGLRDHADLHFEQLIDLSGVDYSTYTGWTGQRFCVSCHLTSLKYNVRLRLRVFAPDENFPVVPSLDEVWNSSHWHEREAFDLYGIMFEGHSDLRRILTDYGFVGHPFRKDFPISGYVEMRYDPVQQRVIYQPVSIEPREVTPRIVREGNYGKVD
jgi:NADH-quinone oxidoreductase subunit C